MTRRPALFSVLTLFASLSATAQGPTLARTMPAGALAYGEGVGLSRVIERVQGAALFQDLISSQAYGLLAQSLNYRKALAAREIVEIQMGLDLSTLAQGMLGGRVAVGIYPSDEGEEPALLAMLRVADATVLARLRARIDPFLVLAEEQVDRSATDTGVELLSFQGRAFAVIGDDWIAASSSRDLLMRTIALVADSEQPSLAEWSEQHTDENLLRLRVDLDAIRHEAGGRVLPEKLGNPLASFLFGGIVELAAMSPYAELQVDLAGDALVFTATLPADSRELGKAHRAFFSDPTTSGSASIPDLPARIGGFTIHRDLGTWYRQREKLLSPEVLPGYDQFESGLANLLPGKDFGEDVLTLLGGNLRFVSAPQDYAHLEGRPGVELPSFGLIVELQDQVKGAGMFRLFFQTISALLNVQAGAQGREPWVMNSETYAGVQISFGEYLEKPAGDRLGMVFNFMPAAARVGDQFIICTSRELCRQLVGALQNPSEEQQTNRNLSFEIHGGPLADILFANRESFHAQGIRGGKSREEAENQLDLILRIVRSFDLARLSTIVEENAFRAKFELRWR